MWILIKCKFDHDEYSRNKYVDRIMSLETFQDDEKLFDEIHQMICRKAKKYDILDEISQETIDWDYVHNLAEKFMKNKSFGFYVDNDEDEPSKIYHVINIKDDKWPVYINEYIVEKLDLSKF